MSERPASRSERFLHRIRSLRAASLSGIAFSILISVSLLWLRDQPGSDSTAAEISAFYSDGAERGRVLLGLNLAAFAAIMFLWFLAVIRRQLGEREDRFFATVFLVSGILFVVLYLVSAAAAAMPVLAVEVSDAPTPSTETLGIAEGLIWGLFMVLGTRMAGVFMLVTSTLGLRTGALPRWLAIVGIVFAAILLATATVSEPVGFLLPIWVVLVSLSLLRRPQLHTEMG